MDKIVLNIGSTNIEGWESISIRRSIEALCGGFEISLSYKNSSIINSITPQASCKILIVDDETGISNLQLTGYIDDRSREKSGESTTLTVKGRDITQDLVDCSAKISSNTRTQSTLAQIVTDICNPFNIAVVDELNNTEKFKEFTLQSGEAAFSAIERVCRQRGAVPMTSPRGELVITNTGLHAEQSGVDLVMGRNIKSLSESWSVTERFSEYTVKGQGSSSGESWSSDSAPSLKGVATDSQITRYRPLIIMAESKATARSVKIRAAWEAQVRACRSKSHQVTVRGWRKNIDSPDLWKINTLTNLIDTSWGIQEQLLITGTEFSLQDGRETILTLKNPCIFAKDPTGGINV